MFKQESCPCYRHNLYKKIEKVTPLQYHTEFLDKHFQTKQASSVKAQRGFYSLLFFS